jgi:CHAT domain-containing protein
MNAGVRGPLLNSGILLAGANVRAASGEEQLEDGILTAYEIASMNLSSTCWVVLSACRTALGKLQAGEGVYGLRRAFQTAGARTVISSLWPIPDKETARVMTCLYGSLSEDLPVAMQRAALERRAEIRKSGLPDHPFSWAAFIAVGDWRAPLFQE